MTSLFWGNNRQHWPVCAKTISSWVRKVLGVAQAEMSLGSLWGGVAASAALAAGVSLVTILQAGDWTRVSTLARHYISGHITTTDRQQDSVQHAVLGLSESVLSWQVSNIDLYSVLHMLGCQAVALPSTEQIVPQLSVWY